MNSITTYEQDDLDGTRGLKSTEYIIEPEDILSIQNQIIEFIELNNELPLNPFWVNLIDSLTEEVVEVELNPFKYFPKIKCKKLLKDY